LTEITSYHGLAAVESWPRLPGGTPAAQGHARTGKRPHVTISGLPDTLFRPCRDSSRPVSLLGAHRTGVTRLIRPEHRVREHEGPRRGEHDAAHCFQKNVGLPEKRPFVLSGLKSVVADDAEEDDSQRAAHGRHAPEQSSASSRPARFFPPRRSSRPTRK